MKYSPLYGGEDGEDRHFYAQVIQCCQQVVSPSPSFIVHADFAMHFLFFFFFCGVMLKSLFSLSSTILADTEALCFNL